MSKKAKQISTHVVVALGAAVVVGGIFTVLSMRTFIKVPVVVAARDITPYSGEIVAEDFKIIEISKGDRANFANFVTDASSLVGKVATTSVYEGQPVKELQFVHPDDAKSLQNIVTKEGHRGLYLPMTLDNALVGDMKTGGVYDFYISVETPKPLPDKPDNVETTVIPLQSSYLINKMTTTEDGSTHVFMEFPEEESEKYVMLKQFLASGKAVLTATMPNAIHENYEAKSLTFTDFFGSLLSDKNYFTSVSQEEDKAETDINVKNDMEITNKDSESNKEQVDNKEN